MSTFPVWGLKLPFYSDSSSEPHTVRMFVGRVSRSGVHTRPQAYVDCLFAASHPLTAPAYPRTITPELRPNRIQECFHPAVARNQGIERWMGELHVFPGRCRGMDSPLEHQVVHLIRCGTEERNTYYLHDFTVSLVEQ